MEKPDNADRLYGRLEKKPDYLTFDGKVSALRHAVTTFLDHVGGSALDWTPGEDADTDGLAGDVIDWAIEVAGIGAIADDRHDH